MSSPFRSRSYEKFFDLAGEFWQRAGYYSATRGSFALITSTQGVLDARDLLAEFALQLPAQEDAAALSPRDSQSLVQIARELMTHDPWRRAFEDHMRVCPGPPIVIQVEK